MKKILLIFITLILLKTTVSTFADQKSSFATTLMNSVYIIDNAYWRDNNLLVFIEISDTWSGADTYSTAEQICGILNDQGFKPVSDYSVSMIEKRGQSVLLKMECKL
jgi:hypothetical protein